MPAKSVLACPASLKGVLSAREAAAALEDGFAEPVSSACPCRSRTAARGRSTRCATSSATWQAEDAVRPFAAMRASGGETG